MFATVTRFQARPGKMGDVAATITKMQREAAHAAGVARQNIVWDERGSGLVFAVYETEAAATAHAIHCEEVWLSLAPCLTGSPMPEAYPLVAEEV